MLHERHPTKTVRVRLGATSGFSRGRFEIDYSLSTQVILILSIYLSFL